MAVIIPAKIPIALEVFMMAFWGIGLVCVPKWMLNSVYNWDTSDLDNATHAAVLVMFQNFGTQFIMYMLMYILALRSGTGSLLANVNIISAVQHVVWIIYTFVTAKEQNERMGTPVAGMYFNIGIFVVLTVLHLLGTDFPLIRLSPASKLSARLDASKEEEGLLEEHGAKNAVNLKLKLYYASYYYVILGVCIYGPWCFFFTQNMQENYGLGRDILKQEHGYWKVNTAMQLMGLNIFCIGFLILGTILANDIMYSYRYNRFLTFFALMTLFQWAFQMIPMQDLGFVAFGNGIQLSLLWNVPLFILGVSALISFDGPITRAVLDEVKSS